jgi:hypothetical protein
MKKYTFSEALTECLANDKKQFSRGTVKIKNADGWIGHYYTDTDELCDHQMISKYDLQSDWIEVETGIVLTEEEKHFTIQEMIKSSMFLISEVGEYEEAACVLNQLLEYHKGNEEKLNEFWYDSLCCVEYEQMLSMYPEEKEIALIESIHDKLYV